MNIAKPPAAMQTYQDELKAYQLRFAAWLGLDPHEVAHLTETKVPVAADAFGPPADLKVTWESFDKVVEAEEHRGRHPLPTAMRGMGGEPTVVTNSVVLDWSEVKRLRAEVGERPKFPEPQGGWPAGWPTS